MAVTTRLLRLCILFAAATTWACGPEGDIEITALEFNGVQQVDEGALRDAIQTRQGSWIPWGRKRYFDRRAFETDLKRIEAFYHDRGFPDARVASVNVELNDAQDKVSITVNVSEGEPIRIAAIDFSGFDVLPEAERRSLEESVEPLVGEPLDRQAAQAVRERALNQLRDNGYPHAEVAIAEEDAGPRQQRIVYRAAPGLLSHFGPIEIQGQMSVGEDVIRRELTFAPGDVYSRRAMRESQRRIYGLELFEFANVESNEKEMPDAPDVPVRVTVAEADHQRVTFGLGYGTEEDARARIRWDHVNFLGGARHAGFEGKWSSLDRGVRTEFSEPFFFTRNFSLNFEGQAWQAAEPVYSLDSLGGRVTLRHEPNTRNVWSVSFSSEAQRSSVTAAALEDFSLRDELIALGLDPTDGEFTGSTTAVSFEARRTTADSLLDARSGYVLVGRVEQAGGWLPGISDYWSVSAEGRHYLSMGGTIVIANRLRAATIDGLGDLQRSVPFYKRYFLGGATSIRGWGRFEVAPTSGFGLPIGGHSMLEGSSELRLPLWGRLGGVVFFDYGNVWSRSWEFDVANLRYAAGPGLRYLTPIGPARIDLGYQLNPIEGLRINGEPERRRWRVHFSIGQAF